VCVAHRSGNLHEKTLTIRYNLNLWTKTPIDYILITNFDVLIIIYS